jgi:A/G-specific adenine glycosylase
MNKLIKSMSEQKAWQCEADDFANRLIAWQKCHGRHDLPWQGSRAPYGIWLSEIMLQQTQVSSVIPYFQKFMARFPDLATLAIASQDEVMACWSGLGYYSRARNLHRAARQVAEKHAGVFPDSYEDILALPGVGRSTASAISAFAFGARRAILDGNVKRVLARYCALAGYPGLKVVEESLWQRAEALLPGSEIETYTQALMDLGATVCTRSKPRCEICPVTEGCLARQQNRQADLPYPKPRKAMPTKETTLLIFLHRGEIYLEKRPPTGIWGGMWSFPEAADENEIHQVCLSRFGFELALPGAALPSRRHTFTHFHLSIAPLLLKVRHIQPQARQSSGVWLNIEEALESGIPSPIRKILEGLLR